MGTFQKIKYVFLSFLTTEESSTSFCTSQHDCVPVSRNLVVIKKKKIISFAVKHYPYITEDGQKVGGIGYIHAFDFG